MTTDIPLEESHKIMTAMEDEAEMLRLVRGIQDAIFNHKTEQVVEFMMKFESISITELMLKKHPDIVLLFRNLLTYGERIPETISQDIEMEKYRLEVRVVRCQALCILIKFKVSNISH
ncbi:uncharacterized protein LOC124170663 [Ischnura elegans]|uniref:uncharacterized protein LOC124170663 n=1 Tax=Ischnura elegans TaxID=197161 RepID=UPI001ED873A1|nr:uncharacterized protein LOC124170663 [Ischnura elegans]